MNRRPTFQFWPPAVLLVAACAVNPVTGRSELSLVSESSEISMGREAARQTILSIGVIPDSNVQALVRHIGLKMAATSERPQLPWTFTAVDDPVVNAFALPGGFIFVTRGLLTHLNSEAELAAVLGHEMGHVTAKHSVHQISQAELAQVGLGVGSLLSSDIAKWSGLASQGLGLLFLKFSRANESQADELGFGYALRNGYDVRAMAETFRMLGRLSAGGGGKLPEWLSTHPDPGNRLQVTERRLRHVKVNLDSATLNRNGYLALLNGMVYGENPRQGFFRGTLFLHPDLRFQFQFATGWQTANQTDAVLGQSPNRDAIVQVSLAANKTPSQASQEFLGQQGVTAGRSSYNAINGNQAITTEFAAQGQQAVLRGTVAFVSYGGNTYQLLGYTTADMINTYSGTFLGAIQSFRQLTDASALNVQPMRVELVRLPRAMTLEQFYGQYPSSIPIEEVGLINDLVAGQSVAGGTTLKRVR